MARQASIFSEHFPILMEAGVLQWGPSPFRFFNSWLLEADCCKKIEFTYTINKLNGWAGFVFFSKLSKVKEAVKEWIKSVDEKKREKPAE